jgi:glycosyltransferase EpsH
MPDSLKYSVIIPAYNAEDTIERCLQSLLVQKREDVEIIVVNDGSTDKTANIINNIAATNKTVVCLHQANGGVSSARNNGLAHATGTYITFVDSDDWVSSDYFETINGVLKDFDYDFIRVSQLTVKGDEYGEKLVPAFDSSNHEEIIQRLVSDMCQKHINSPTGMFYKRQIIEENAVRFKEDIEVGEDRTFNIQYALNIKSFRVLENPLYIICLENETSLSRKKRDDLDEQIEKAEEHLREVLRESDLSEEEKLKIIEAINFDNLRAVYTKAKYLHRNKLPYFKRLKELNKYCKQVNDKNLTYPSGKFCTLIKLPVVLKITPLIDAMGWVLTR